EEDVDNLLNYRDLMGRPVEFDAATQKRYDDLVDEGQRFGRLSKIGFGLAGVAAASAIVFFIFDSGDSEDSEGMSALAPMITPSQTGTPSLVGVQTQWRF